MAGNGETVIALDAKRMAASAAKDIATLKELAPQLAAIGVFEPRDPQIAHLVDVATHTD